MPAASAKPNSPLRNNTRKHQHPAGNSGNSQHVFLTRETAMKHLILAILALTASLWGCGAKNPGHASRNALDWPGTYAGVLPCADCEGIQTTLTINADQTYVLITKYLGKDGVFEHTGSFTWAADDSTLFIEDDGIVRAYRADENTLTHLDMNGQPITGALANRYVLHKQKNDTQDPLLTGIRWKLVELLGKPVAPNPSGKLPFILLNAEERRISGFGGCNTISGSFELKMGKRLRFSNMASTLMACLDMEAEQQLFDVLGMVDNYACDGQTLSLHKARMAPLARFEAMPIQ